MVEIKLAKVQVHHLSSHSCKYNTPKPLNIDVMRWVDRPALSDQHWIWKTDPPVRRFNQHGHAVWAVKTISYMPRQTFVVARLLLDAILGPFPYRTSFKLLCGLPQCVNPHHWAPALRLPIYHLLASAAGWRVHRIRTGQPTSKNLPFAARVADIVHVIPFPADPFQMLTTMCGVQVYPANVVIMPPRTIVTCTGGC